MRASVAAIASYVGSYEIGSAIAGGGESRESRAINGFGDTIVGVGTAFVGPGGTPLAAAAIAASSLMGLAD